MYICNSGYTNGNLRPGPNDIFICFRSYHLAEQTIIVTVAEQLLNSPVSTQYEIYTSTFGRIVSTKAKSLKLITIDRTHVAGATFLISRPIDSLVHDVVNL